MVYSSVYSDMCFKIVLLYQCLNKLKWFFPSVCWAVNIKIVFCWEGFITLTALIWVIPNLCTKLCFEIALLWEGLVTLAALKCFFPSRSSCEDQDCVLLKRLYHIDCIDMGSCQCVSESVFWDCSFVRRLWHTEYIGMDYPRCVSWCVI